jgi:hypothetical protein
MRAGFQVVLRGVTVTNWSKEPNLRLDWYQQQDLIKAIDCSREIVDDSVSLLNAYLLAPAMALADAQTAAYLFPSSHKDAVDEALETYFGLKPATQPQVRTILAKFKQIQTGISGAFDIVVGHIFDMDDLLQGIGDAIRSLVHGSPNRAAADLAFIKQGTEGWIGPSSHQQQRIHLNTHSLKILTPGKVARIIVHEASHKFADTADVAYKWEAKRDHGGYKTGYNTGAQDALSDNADSYAWGGRHMWKRKRNKAPGS